MRVSMARSVKPVFERRGLTLACCFLLPAMEFQVWLLPYQRGFTDNGMVLAVVLCKHLVPSPRGYTSLSQMSPDSTVLWRQDRSPEIKQISWEECAIWCILVILMCSGWRQGDHKLDVWLGYVVGPWQKKKKVKQKQLEKKSKYFICSFQRQKAPRILGWVTHVTWQHTLPLQRGPKQVIKNTWPGERHQLWFIW